MTSPIVIYAATTPTGCYVGQTRKYGKRKGEHLRRARNGTHTNPHFARALLKYGEQVKWEIVGLAFSQDAANEVEQSVITHENTMHPHGYNLREGGNCSGLTDAQREKIRRARTGKPSNNRHGAGGMPRRIILPEKELRAALAQGGSQMGAAAIVGCSENVIRKRMIEFGIPRNPVGCPRKAGK